MAKIVDEGADKPWTARIRCAHPVSGRLHRVDGCFSIIEITLDDIKSSSDSDGDWSFWVTCPKCEQMLYPEWQIGPGPLTAIKNRASRTRR